MKEVIEHLTKLLECDKMIITGSFALKQVGLTDKVKDLDIILIKPSENTLSVLNRLHEPYGDKDYPQDPFQFRININGVSVDVWCEEKDEPSIEIKYEGIYINIAMVSNIIKAKKRQKRLKDILQLKKIAEKFYTSQDMGTFLAVEQAKY